jgi:hypothetical protein
MRIAIKPEKFCTRPVKVVTIPQQKTNRGIHRFGRIFLSTIFEAMGRNMSQMFETGSIPIYESQQEYIYMTFMVSIDENRTVWVTYEA